MIDTEQLITQVTAAKLLGCRPSNICKLFNAGRLQVIDIDGVRFTTVQSVDLLKESRNNSALDNRFSKPLRNLQAL